MYVYFLEGAGNGSIDLDDPAIVGSDQDGVLVECGLDEASRLAAEWGLRHPMLAKDGIHYSESGDYVCVANGQTVKDIETVARFLEWSGDDDPEEYLRQIGGVF